MSLFGRVFGKPTGAEEEDDAEVERCLQQISDARHAEDRRDAMQQLCGLVKDNMRAQAAIGTMGLPVLLSVLQEDRDDLELLKGALEVLHASTALPEGGAAAIPPAGTPEDAGPLPALITADLFCRAPDNVLMLLSVLRPAPEGCEDFYVRYTALQALGALLAACPDKLQAAVLSSPVGVTSLMEVLAQPLEVLRNEALLLLVGLCSDCPEVAKLAAFEGAFEKLLPLCAADGGPSSGDVVVADAAELINNLLRGNTDIQRLFREMGFISQLPPLLEFTPPPAAAAAQQAPPAGAASGFFAAAASYADPSLRAAASAAANSAVGVAAAAAAAAAGAAASLWPLQVSANYLCLLETARVLLAAPHAASEAQREQEAANRTANQEALGQLGLLQRLVALSIPGAPSAAVRAQALFCAGDLVWGHAGLQEYLASITVLVPGQQQQQQELPYLQAVLRLMLHSGEPMERAGASHLLQGFCHGNVHGKPAVIATVVPAAAPSTFGEELLAALLAQQQQQQQLNQAGGAAKALGGTADQQLQLQLVAGRAGMALAHLLDQNPSGAQHLLSIRLPAAPGGPASGAAAAPAPPLPPPPGPPGAAAASGDNSTVMRRVVHLLSEGARRPDGQALPLCYSMLRLLIAWCNGCGAAVSALLADSSHLPLLVDLVGGRLPAGDVHTAGLAAVLLGVCLMYAPGSPVAAQQPQQQQQHALQQPPSMLAPPPMHLHQQPQQLGAAAGGGGLHFDALLDVLLSRVGLSQFVAVIDSMQASPLFQAARAAPRLPTHITRSMAGAILESEVAGAARGAAAAAGAAALVGGALGLLSQAAGPSSGGGAPAAGHPDAQQQHQQHHHASAPEAQPFDQPFTLAAEAVAATVQQLTLNAFSSGGGGGGGSGGSMLSPAAGAGFGAPASKLPLPSPQPASVLPPPPIQALPPQFALPQHPAQQPGAPPMHRPLIPLPPSAPGALPMVPLMPGSTVAQGGAAAAAGASMLPGATLSGPSTPAAAATAAAAGAGLAVPTGAPPLTPPGSSLPPAAAAALSPAPAGPPLGAAAAAAAAVPMAAVPAAVPALQQLQQQLQQAGNEPALSLLGQLQGQTAEAKLLSALDALAQLQASAEELRSRNRSLAEDLIRVSQSKHIGAAATANGGGPAPATANGQQPDGGGETVADVDARMAAQLRASRAELELGACRQQLAAMEQRASALEADAAAAREAAEEARDAAATAQADLSSLSSAYNDLEAHAFRLEEQLQQQQQQPGGGTAAAAAPGTAAGADADARVAAAAAEARAAAEAEAAEEMEDLLACLGEEQAKVEVLAARLGELGQDVDALLATVAADGGDGNGGCDGGGAGGEDNELL